MSKPKSWYAKQEEKELKDWKNKSERMIPYQDKMDQMRMNIESWLEAPANKGKLYNQDLINELMTYGTTITKEDMINIANSREETKKRVDDFRTKYPLTTDQAFGGKRPILYGTGGSLNQDDNSFFRLWDKASEGFNGYNRSPCQNESGGYVWPTTTDRTDPFGAIKYPLTSYKFGFINFDKDGKFEEYIGTYPRKMLLLL